MFYNLDPFPWKFCVLYFSLMEYSKMGYGCITEQTLGE